jgi:hypothetical protein
MIAGLGAALSFQIDFQQSVSAGGRNWVRTSDPSLVRRGFLVVSCRRT